MRKIAEPVNKTCALFNCVDTLQKTMNSNNAVNYIFPCRDINDEYHRVEEANRACRSRKALPEDIVEGREDEGNRQREP